MLQNIISKEVEKLLYRELLTIPEAAKLFGTSKETIRDLIAKEELKVTYLNNKKRIARSTLQRWISNNTI